jgi:hypothetical protein
LRPFFLSLRILGVIHYFSASQRNALLKHESPISLLNSLLLSVQRGDNQLRLVVTRDLLLIYLRVQVCILTAEGLVQFQIKSCGIYGEQSELEKLFSEHFGFPYQFSYYTIIIFLICYTGLVRWIINRLSTKGFNLIPS